MVVDHLKGEKLPSLFSEEKIPDLDIRIESKDIIYNLPSMASINRNDNTYGDLQFTIVIPRHPHHGQYGQQACCEQTFIIILV